MQTKGKRLVTWLIFLAGCFSLTALAGNSSRIGTGGAQELLIPGGARGLAFGSSYMAFATGTEAIFWNPAGLSRMDGNVEVLVSHMQYIADIGVDYGAVGVKAGDFGSLGFTLKSITFGDIPITTTQFPDGTGGVYSPTFITAGVTYSKLLTDRISVGFTTSLVTEKITSVSASGVAFDAAIQYKNLGYQGLNLGIAIKNVGPQMKFTGPGLLVSAISSGTNRGTQNYAVDAASFDLPSSLEIGLGYNRQFDDENSAEIGGMFRSNNYQDDEYSFGGEYNFNNLFFVRGGYTWEPQATDDPTGARAYPWDYTFGAGVHYDFTGLSMTLDYAYRHVKYFTNNNIIALRIGF